MCAKCCNFKNYKFVTEINFAENEYIFWIFHFLSNIVLEISRFIENLQQKRFVLWIFIHYIFFRFFQIYSRNVSILTKVLQNFEISASESHACANATAGAVRRISLFQTTLKQNTMERQDPIKDKAAYTSLKRHRTLCALSIQSAPPNILFPHKKTGREIFPCLFEIHIGVYACTFFLSSSSCSRSSFGSLSPNFL